MQDHALIDRAPAAPSAAIIIPARFASSRFPGKPLVQLRGAGGLAKTLIERSWSAARAVAGVSEIWIATEDPRIAEAAEKFGARVVLTPSACRNGTERCWAAVQAAGIDADVIVNLQGDAPLTPPIAAEALVAAMHDDAAISVASAMVRCSELMIDRLLLEQRVGASGGTTVVFDRRMDALYFSKRVIPFVPERVADAPVYYHIGLYAYRRDALRRYAESDPTQLEQFEGLEQLRFLDAGIGIRMVEVPHPPGGLWEVNRPSDILPVEAALSERRLT